MSGATSRLAPRIALGRSSRRSSRRAPNRFIEAPADEGVEGRTRHRLMFPSIVVTKVFVVEGVRKEQVHLTQFPGASVEREVEARLVFHLKRQISSPRQRLFLVTFYREQIWGSTRLMRVSRCLTILARVFPQRDDRKLAPRARLPYGR